MLEDSLALLGPMATDLPCCSRTSPTMLDPALEQEVVSLRRLDQSLSTTLPHLSPSTTILMVRGFHSSIDAPQLAHIQLSPPSRRMPIALEPSPSYPTLLLLRANPLHLGEATRAPPHPHQPPGALEVMVAGEAHMGFESTDGG